MTTGLKYIKLLVEDIHSTTVATIGTDGHPQTRIIDMMYYLFDYYDEVLKDIERVTDIDFGKRIRTLGEIKKVLAKTQKQKKHHENLTKQKARQALYLLGLTGVLYPFSCKSQGLSQLLEYEKSMRTTAFLPFIPCEK